MVFASAVSQFPSTKAPAGALRWRTLTSGVQAPVGFTETRLFSESARIYAVAGVRSNQAAGDTGPLPAPVAVMAAAISARSATVSFTDPASIQPSTWAGSRAPTMAAVTPGQASVQAIATEATDVP